MNKLIIRLYQIYFGVLSRLAPSYAAERAVSLIFSVNKDKNQSTQLPKADETIALPSGGHLLKWSGNQEKSILLIHGWNGSLDQFENLFGRFIEKGFTVYGLTPVGHGRSHAKQSHPGEFVAAIKEAIQIVPNVFDMAIGHSMGAGTLAVAAAEVNIAKKLALIASPASFFDVIQRFALALKLNRKATVQFSRQVESLVGLSHSELEVHEKVKSLSIPCVLVHDESDREVPYHDALRLLEAIPEVELFTTKNEGHNRILKSKIVEDSVMSQLSVI